MTTRIFIRLKVEGLHRWPDCDIQEVDYLANLHRHNFGITCWHEVNHDNRDIEFIQLKHKVKDWLLERYWKQVPNCLVFGAMSCEMIAKELIKEFGFDRVTVDEDGENGAEVLR